MGMRLVLGITLLSLCAPAAPPARRQGLEHSFYTVIRNNDLPALQQLLKQTKDADHRKSSTYHAHRTIPMMYASAIGSLEAMKMLVAAGAGVNDPNFFGGTPLMWSAGNLEKVQFLLSKGANVNARSWIGRTPLLVAASSDGSTEIARLLIEKGAVVGARDESGFSVLEAAATMNNVEVARLLLANGADPNTPDDSGFTPLLQAAANGDRSAAMVKLLLEHGADPNATCRDKLRTVKNGTVRLGRLTPLLLAAPHANYETVSMLIKAGADVNAQDVRGMTPLALAVATDHADPRIVRLLLASGADPTIASVEGETAADWAGKYGDPEILSAFHLRPQSPVPQPASAASPSAIPVALERSVALMQRNSSQFLNAGGCFSCHAQHQAGLAAAVAWSAGVKVDWALEIEQSRAIATMRGGLEQSLYQAVDPPSGVAAQELTVMQLSGDGIPPQFATDSLVFHIASLQRKEGDWPNYGPVRPPLEDGGFSNTAKGIRSLRLGLLPARKAEFEERIARAADWLTRASPRSTEDRTMQLLGIVWAGRKPPEDRLRQLIDLQHPDGGWGQTEFLASDAYATGEVLFALHEAGISATEPVYLRGVEFLLRTQKEDGSWRVRTRAVPFQPYFQSGFPHDHDQWISQSGTAWAVMALSIANQQRSSLPNTAQPAP